MSQIVLFGGAFNPPHLGHLLVIAQAFELIPTIDELWLLPAHKHTFGKEMASSQHRLAMCQLLLQNISLPNIKLCSIEIDQKLSGQTYETFRELTTQFPQHTFSFLMGSDQIPHFHKWGNYQKLLAEMQFYVYPRAHYSYEPTYPQMNLLESETQVITNISSTLIRQRMRLQLGLHPYLPVNIAEYIASHRVYDQP